MKALTALLAFVMTSCVTADHVTPDTFMVGQGISEATTPATFLYVAWVIPQPSEFTEEEE